MSSYVLVLRTVLLLLVTFLPYSYAQNLSDALSYAATDSELITYTDWASIRSDQNLNDSDSQASIDDRLNYLLEVNKTHMAASIYASSHILSHTETWAFDLTDLDWELTISREGMTTYVLKFRDNFDLERINTKFKERKFTLGDYQGIPIYSHDIDPSQAWLAKSDFSILNTAVLSERKILLLSSSLNTLKESLDAYINNEVLSEDRQMRTLIDSLGVVESALIQLGIDTCINYSLEHSLNNQLGGILGNIQQSLNISSPQLHAYNIFVLAHRPKTAEARAVFAFSYEDARQAFADFTDRRDYAENGISLRTMTALTDSLFRLENTIWLWQHIVLEGSAINLPRNLLQMVYDRDIVFASCSVF